MPKQNIIISDTPLNLESELSQKLAFIGETKASTRLGRNVKYMYAPSLADIDTGFGEITAQKPEYTNSLLAEMRTIPGSNAEVVEIDENELDELLGNLSIGGKRVKKSRRSSVSKTSKKSKKSKKSNKSNSKKASRSKKSRK